MCPTLPIWNSFSVEGVNFIWVNEIFPLDLLTLGFFCWVFTCSVTFPYPWNIFLWNFSFWDFSLWNFSLWDFLFCLRLFPLDLFHLYITKTSLSGTFPGTFPGTLLFSGTFPGTLPGTFLWDCSWNFSHWNVFLWNFFHLAKSGPLCLLSTYSCTFCSTLWKLTVLEMCLCKMYLFYAFFLNS